MLPPVFCLASRPLNINEQSGGVSYMPKPAAIQKKSLKDRIKLNQFRKCMIEFSLRYPLHPATTRRTISGSASITLR